MFLCTELGGFRGVYDMLDTMSPEELNMWKSYYILKNEDEEKAYKKNKLEHGIKR